MKLCTQIFLVVVSLIVGILYSQYIQISAPRPVPKLDTNAYWGPGSGEDYVEDENITLSQIRYRSVPIAKLREELNVTLNLHPPLEGIAFEYGVNSDTMQRVIEYWRDDYLVRWLSREVSFNRMPHFMTQVQG